MTHEAPAQSPENGVYTFVTGGIEEALAQARAAAGDGAVCVMGGADVARQYLAAGLVDEISLHVVPRQRTCSTAWSGDSPRGCLIVLAANKHPRRGKRRHPALATGGVAARAGRPRVIRCGLRRKGPDRPSGARASRRRAP